MTLVDYIKRLFGAEFKSLGQYTGDLPGGKWTKFDLDVSHDYEEWLDIWMKNAIVQGCVSAYALTMPEAPLSIRTGEEELTREHPLFTDVIGGDLTPVSEHRLWVSTYTALGIGGNAYWHKRRDGNVVKGVRLLTDENVTPIPNSYGEIEHYAYRSGTYETEIPTEDIVHITGFWINPSMPWKGASPIELASTSSKSYNEALTAVYSMLKNDAVPRTIFNYDDPLSPEQMAVLSQTFSEKYGGRNRGKSAHMWGLNRVDRLGLDMQELAVESLTTSFEANICSTYRVHPIVAMTAAGLASSTYANFEQASKDFTTYSRVPLWDIIASQVERGFENEYPDIDLEFDLSFVQSLQPDPDEKRATAITAFSAGIMTRDEAREEFGLEAGVQDDTPAAPATDDTTNDTTPEERALIKKYMAGQLDPADLPDEVWVKAVDELTEDYADKLASDYRRVLDDLEESILTSVKSRGGAEFKRFDEAINWQEWIAQFLSATLDTRTAMVEELIVLSLQDVGSNVDEFADDYSATRQGGIDESSDKIAESVGTIRDEVRQVLRDTAGSKPDEIEAALQSKFSTLKASRARAVGRTTATATTGTTQKATWSKMNERISDPKRKIKRRWIALDGARDDHKAARGQYEDESGNFRVGSETTPYPAGPGLSAGNAVNCRCYTRAVRAGRI